MEIPVLTLPKPVPIQRMRKPQDNIPQTRSERDLISQTIRRYVAEVKPVPPLPMDQLRDHADVLIGRIRCDAKYRDYIAVCLSNEAWRDQLATVPFERRLLLMPKCMRVEDKCPAPFDEFGLLCKKCGLCSIQDLQDEAERLGYAVLCAEGSAIVMAIIQTGKIEAIVGVSCLSVLERAFPHMEAAAIPGIAIPLLQDDCADTNVDMDAIWEIIHLSSDDRTHRLDLEAVRHEVDSWFTTDSLAAILGPAQSKTDELGRAWLAKNGKRWRPFLSVCTFKALKGDVDVLPDDLKKVAIAVECFHKASLIHDDIEDDDAIRYGEKTLHEEQGVAVALNVGDFLLGEGYRLIAECDAPAQFKVEMLKVAAIGHRTLSLGQGAELCWARSPNRCRHCKFSTSSARRRPRRLKSPFGWARCTPASMAKSATCWLNTANRLASPIKSETTWKTSPPAAMPPTTWRRCAPPCCWPSPTNAPRAKRANSWKTSGDETCHLRLT